MFLAAFSKLLLNLLMDGMDKMYCHHINLGYVGLSKVIPSYTKVFPLAGYHRTRCTVFLKHSTTKPSFIFCRTRWFMNRAGQQKQLGAF